MPAKPPQGNQKQYVEKAGHVYGEQYKIGQPLPVGVVAAITGDPLHPASGGPYAVTLSGILPMHDTDWVVTSRRTGMQTGVLTDEEFTERYG